MRRTFTFKKGNNDLSKSPEAMANRINCHYHVFELKDFQVQFGHDDSLPYTAILRIDGKNVGRMTNDGWGGETEFSANDDECAEIYAKVTDDVVGYSTWTYYDKKSKIDVSIPFFCDIIADSLNIELESKKSIGK